MRFSDFIRKYWVFIPFATPEGELDFSEGARTDQKFYHFQSGKWELLEKEELYNTLTLIQTFEDMENDWDLWSGYLGPSFRVVYSLEYDWPVPVNRPDFEVPDILISEMECMREKYGDLNIKVLQVTEDKQLYIVGSSDEISKISSPDEAIANPKVWTTYITLSDEVTPELKKALATMVNEFPNLELRGNAIVEYNGNFYYRWLKKHLEHHLWFLNNTAERAASGNYSGNVKVGNKHVIDMWDFVVIIEDGDISVKYVIGDEHKFSIVMTSIIQAIFKTFPPSPPEKEVTEYIPTALRGSVIS